MPGNMVVPPLHRKDERETAKVFHALLPSWQVVLQHAWHGMALAGTGKARHVFMAATCITWHDNCMPWHCIAWQWPWHGMAWRGMAWHGVGWHAMARHGVT